MIYTERCFGCLNKGEIFKWKGITFMKTTPIIGSKKKDNAVFLEDIPGTTVTFGYFEDVSIKCG